MAHTACEHGTHHESCEGLSKRQVGGQGRAHLVVLDQQPAHVGGRHQDERKGKPAAGGCMATLQTTYNLAVRYQQGVMQAAGMRVGKAREGSSPLFFGELLRGKAPTGTEVPGAAKDKSRTSCSGSPW